MIVNTLAPPTPLIKANKSKSDHHPEPELPLSYADVSR